jgi:hypothetical protein
MAEYFFVAPMTTPVGTLRSRPCATLDSALRGANFLLGNGAASVWIVDSDDNMVLTAEQVRFRLKQPKWSQTSPIT